MENGKPTRLVVNLSRKAIGRVALSVQFQKELHDAALLAPTGQAGANQGARSDGAAEFGRTGHRPRRGLMPRRACGSIPTSSPACAASRSRRRSRGSRRPVPRFRANRGPCWPTPTPSRRSN